ncbi:pseudouridine synthase [Eubacterium xylanophilum]|uniref:pseudouridine synthase n=1 Tax=Eubacterium xylanophilum TaxID=39497 RepID=UPI00047CA9F6|nr:16S rRNA pseudouridine(516) synthase [Eubacterium xylanophilum]
MEIIRLDKFISENTEFSRAQVKKLIKMKRVMVDSDVATGPDQKIDIDESIVYISPSAEESRRIIFKQDKYQFIMLHKPAGVVSATRDREETVIDLITSDNYMGAKGDAPMVKNDIFPMGRLDKDTEGLLILTNDGELSHKLLSPRNHISKTYYVELENIPKDMDIQRIESGMDIGEKNITKPAKYEKIDDKSGFLTITEGKFHQIKRMFMAVDNRVVYLKRVSMAGIELDPSLPPGKWRLLTEQEVEKLRRN